MKTICTLAMLIAMLVSVSANVNAFEAAQYFQDKCMSCHTVGQGDDVGPDLKDVSKRRKKAWLIRFIQESQSMIEEGDPIANELFTKYKKKKMPDQELSKSEVEDLITYIDSGKVVALVAKIRSALDANPFELKTGHELFAGIKPLAKGGPACISCHSAGKAGYLGGGTLGPDLTNVYTSYSDKGLSKVMTRISFPTMIHLYKNKELTEEEVYQIKSFLWSVDREEKIDHGYSKKFFFLGFIGFLLMLGVFDLLWKGRRNSKKK